MVALAFVCLLGCGRTVRLTVVDAPTVSLPPGGSTVAVVLEAPDDRSRALRDGLHRGLGASPQLAMVEATPCTGVAPLQLSVGRVSTVGRLLFEEIDDGWCARREVSASAPLSLTRCDGGSVDALEPASVARSWVVCRPTQNAARRALPDEDEAALLSAGALGEGYAGRVSTQAHAVRRRWLTAGDPRLSSAFHTARASDLRAASRMLSEVLADPAAPASVRARAEHDLAVVHELDGDSDRALRAAERAVAWDRLAQTERYAERLRAVAAAELQLGDARETPAGQESPTTPEQ